MQHRDTDIRYLYFPLLLLVTKFFKLLLTLATRLRQTCKQHPLTKKKKHSTRIKILN